MKRLILLLCALATPAFGENVFVTNDPGHPIPITGAAAGSSAGAANLVTAQTTTSGSASTLVIARATRRQVTIKNTDTTITVYVGPATVTTANGMPIKAGESITLRWVGLVQVIAASGTPVVATADEYD